MSILRFVGVIVVFLLFATSASAQTLNPLTPDTVEGFITSLQDMQEIAKKYDAMGLMQPDTSADATMARAAAPFSAAIAQMQGHQAYGEMLAALERHGFSDIQHWGTIGDRVMKAFVANKVGAEMPQMDQQMMEAVEQIEKSNMSAEQKQAMLQMMQSSKQMINAYSDVPGADKSAVLPFMSVIEAMGQQ